MGLLCSGRGSGIENGKAHAVVTPEKEKNKRTQPRKLIAQARSENWAREQESKRETPCCGCEKRKASKKTKKENKQKLTPETYEKFPG